MEVFFSGAIIMLNFKSLEEQGKLIKNIIEHRRKLAQEQ